MTKIKTGKPYETDKLCTHLLLGKNAGLTKINCLQMLNPSATGINNIYGSFTLVQLTLLVLYMSVTKVCVLQLPT